MESDPASSLISVVITVRDEAPRLPRLLDSLRAQAGPWEVVVVVDSESRDASFAIAQEYAQRYPDRFRVVLRRTSRGMGRNVGARWARGSLLAFTDGDCYADPHWLERIRDGFRFSRIVAGRTEVVGPTAYRQLERVELYQAGSDVTYPSCNLAYERGLFEALHGFDPRFVTAEDIDLNLRAARLGVHVRFEPDAVIYHEARPTFVRFLYQAFWNGYGRKQLTEKHGQLWGQYRYRRLLARQSSALGAVRLAAALLGYFFRVVSAGPRRIGPTDDPSAGGMPRDLHRPPV